MDTRKHFPRPRPISNGIGKTVVVALGGSIAYKEAEIDVSFLRKFNVFLRQEIKRGKKFVVVIGGGHLARFFQKAVQDIKKSLPDEEKDWIGIHATRMNAQLLRAILKDIADPVVFDSRGKMKRLKHPVTIASGWRPGWSTDFVAAAIAHDLGIKEFVVAGKPAYVYPVRGPAYRQAGAKGSQRASASNGMYSLDMKHPFLKLSWGAYRRMIPAKWIPGFHSPVDPVAARLAHSARMQAVIINGKDLKNFRNLLNGKGFRGTIIGAD